MLTPMRSSWAAGAGLLLLLAGCGGGGGGGSSTPSVTGPPANPVWTLGHYDPPATFAAHCALPRSGVDPYLGTAYPDRAGSTVWENHWIRAWSQAYYLWYRELPDLDPAAYSTTAAYFKLLKTPAVTSAGTAKDHFHFTYSTATWESFVTSGVQLGYGATWAFLAVAPPRELVVAYTEPNSPAANAGLLRGDSVLQIDGIDLVHANDQPSIDRLNAALSPSSSGASHTFTVVDALGGNQRTVTLAAANVTSTPVQNVKTLTIPNGIVGYLTFNDHIQTAEGLFRSAVQQLATAQVTDLVLDMRYNGGGLLSIASEVGYMIAGQAQTNGRTFELIQFNDKYPNTDPLTGAALAPTPFYSSVNGSTLPSLNLSRVFVLTSNDTCSASESVINGLRGVGVTVVQIGSQTCGKPYGFYPEDNCGTTYFSIQFRGVNALGFGDYADGFVPQNATAQNGGVPLPGCAVADDFGHALGDPAEARLAAALSYIQSGSCPSPSGLGAPGTVPMQAHVVKPVWLMNRILRRPR